MQVKRILENMYKAKEHVLMYYFLVLSDPLSFYIWCLMCAEKSLVTHGTLLFMVSTCCPFCLFFVFFTFIHMFLFDIATPPQKKKLCKGQIFILTWFLLSKMFGWVGIISSVSTTISPFLCLCWQVSSSWQISVDKNRFLVYNFVKNWLNVYYFAGITLYNVQWNSWRFPLRRCGCD